MKREISFSTALVQDFIMEIAFGLYLVAGGKS
jgi:hypothetical protein